MKNLEKKFKESLNYVVVSTPLNENPPEGKTRLHACLRDCELVQVEGMFPEVSMAITYATSAVRANQERAFFILSRTNNDDMGAFVMAENLWPKPSKETPTTGHMWVNEFDVGTVMLVGELLSVFRSNFVEGVLHEFY